MAVDHPSFGTFCCICFRRLTPQTCAVDIDDVKWDACPGACAREAGIPERPQCRDPQCKDFGDPDFGELSCPAEHAEIR